MMHANPRFLLVPLTFLSVMNLYQLPAFSQNTSLSPSLSSPLVQSTNTSGFNSTFDAESSNFTNSEMHTDISDPTHSQLLGSSLTPASIPAVNGFVDSAPQTGTLSDAQLAIRYGEGAFAGRRDSAFSSASTSAGFGSLGATQSFRGGSGAALGRASFSGTGAARTSLVAPSSSSTGAFSALSTSGTAPISLDPRLVSTPRVDSFGSSASAAMASDPVLTGALSGQEAVTQTLGNLPSPSTQTALFFASSFSPTPQYQYEDGQTPALMVYQTPGTVLGSAPSYGVASNGFPDSTEGLAGLLAESEVLGSPLERHETGISPLASSMAGNGSGLRQRLNPNLHASPPPAPPQTFAAFERQAQEKRLISGLSISQSSMIYQQDLRDYQRRGQRRSSLARSNALLHSGPQQEIIQNPMH